MFPDSIHSEATVGEKRVYEFLRDSATPDDKFIAWYSPDIEDREPDFILLSPDSGLIVLEVKDWTIDQILELDPKTALLRIGSKSERRKQPLAQAREYVNNILSLLSRKGELDPFGKRELPCPVTWGAVFPHISREEWAKSPFRGVLKEERVLFWDEVREDSGLRGEAFAEWIKDRFPPRFPFRMDAAKIDKIRKAIFPIAVAKIPARAGKSSQERTTILLDHDQENLARTLGSGRLLIDGPAGSGKTLVVASRAINLLQSDRRIKRALAVCFNLSLAGYIKRLICERGGALGSGGIDVMPFYPLCEEIIGEKLEHLNQGSDYYELVVNMSLERLEKDAEKHRRWDAILVDEGQDFSAPMARVIEKLLKPGASLTVVQDGNQRLYQSGEDPWRGIEGMEIRRFKRQYRNTRRIALSAAKFAELEAPELMGASGEKPRVIDASDFEEQIRMMADAIVDLVKRGEPASEIAALYSSSAGERTPERVMEALEERGVLSRWLSRDVSSKRFYDITTDSVTISTIHSAKGMDFANVFIINFERLRKDDEKARRLAYVGMTRARERLCLCSSRDKIENK